MSLEIQIDPEAAGMTPARAARLSRFGRGVLARVGRRGWHVSVLIVGDAAIRALNRRWRRHDRATDVLSFPAGEGPGPACLLGDVVISAPRAAEQARRFRVTLDRELKRLLVHGILHLMGYDHMTAADRRTMRAAEDRLLDGRSSGGWREPETLPADRSGFIARTAGDVASVRARRRTKPRKANR